MLFLGANEFLLQIYLFVTVLAVVYSLPQDASNRTPISEDSLDAALSDRRYLMRQLKCALGEAPCDPVGRRLKSELIKHVLQAIIYNLILIWKYI